MRGPGAQWSREQEKLSQGQKLQRTLQQTTQPRLPKTSSHHSKMPWLFLTPRKVQYWDTERKSEEKTAPLALPANGRWAMAGFINTGKQIWLLTKSPPVPGDQSKEVTIPQFCLLMREN